MKSILSLRLLCLLGFLLLIAPFYDQCNGHGMRKVEEGSPVEVIDTTAVVIDTTIVDTTVVETNAVKNNNSIEQNPIATDSVGEVETIDTPFYEKAYEFIDDEETLNAYEFAVNSLILFEGSFLELKKGVKKGIKENDYSGLFVYLTTLCFLFIILFSISMLILSFFNKVKLIRRFSKINLVLVFITIICILFFEPFFETYKQFKWGYYAFTLVQLGIFYTSKYQITNPIAPQSLRL